MFKKVLLFGLALLFVSMFACVSNVSKKAPAPNFTLQSIDGKTVSLSDFKGKMVFLDFWASWCPPCRMSIPAVEDLNAKFLDREDIVVIGINVGENKDAVASFAKQNNMSYLVLLSNDDVLSKYSITSIPRFVIIDKDGLIVGSWSGYSKDLEDEWIRILEGK